MQKAGLRPHMLRWNFRQNKYSTSAWHHLDSDFILYRRQEQNSSSDNRSCSWWSAPRLSEMEHFRQYLSCYDCLWTSHITNWQLQKPLGPPEHRSLKHWDCLGPASWLPIGQRLQIKKQHEQHKATYHWNRRISKVQPQSRLWRGPASQRAGRQLSKRKQESNAI